MDDGVESPRKVRKFDQSDTDFAEDPADSEADDEDDDMEGPIDSRGLGLHESTTGGMANHSKSHNKQVGEFRRTRIAPPLPDLPGPRDDEAILMAPVAQGCLASTPTVRSLIAGADGYQYRVADPQAPRALTQHTSESAFRQVQGYHKNCLACGQIHASGTCTLKRTGYEHCGLCGLAHFASSRNCPHMLSETQVRGMLKALKASTESKEEVTAARKFLQGVVGNLVLKKKKEAQRIAGLRNGQAQSVENLPPKPPQSQNRPTQPSNSNSKKHLGSDRA